MKKLFCITLFCVCSVFSSAQERKLPVEVIVTRIQHGNIRGFLEKTTEAVFKIYNASLIDSSNITSPCIVLKSQEAENERSIDQSLKTFTINGSKIHLLLETWEDDKGETHIRDKGDDLYSLTNIDFSIDSLEPGVFSLPYTFKSTDKKFSIAIKLRYGMPIPEPITKDGNETVITEKNTVSLKSALALENKTGLKYMWEFKNVNDKEWMLLRQSPSESIVILPEKDLIKSIIKKNLEIQLRYKSYSREISGPYSDPITLEFTPTAPKVNKEFIKIEATCPNQPSGKISFTKILTNADSAAWFVIKGNITNETATVDHLLSSKENPENLDAGNYTAVVYNAGLKTGNVFTAVPFSIEKHPSLSVRKTDKKDATCPKAEDGEITLEADGGAPGKLKFFISPSVGKTDANNRSAIFRNILPGYYNIVISDACEQTVTVDAVEIKSLNESLHGSVNKITPPVDNEANGFLNISIEGGSGSYNYVLSKDGATPVVRSSSNFITIDRIQKGNYKLSITDSRLAGCSAWDTSFTVQSINSELSIDTAAVQKEAEMKRLFYGASEKKAITNAAFKSGALAGDYIIVIEKSAYTLKVYNSKKELIVTYPVVFGNDLLEDKMVEGDKQTPEGYFTIIEKKEHDKWNKFLLLDYPTAESYRRFIDRKAKNLIAHNAEIGHSIGIHGIWATDNITVDMKKNWTDGCISTKNIFIEELYNYMPVGTRVLIKK